MEIESLWSIFIMFIYGGESRTEAIGIVIEDFRKEELRRYLLIVQKQFEINEKDVSTQ